MAIYTEAFTGANGSALPSPWATLTGAAAWGAPTIQSNRGQANSGSPPQAGIVNAGNGTHQDHTVAFDVFMLNTSGGLYTFTAESSTGSNAALPRPDNAQTFNFVPFGPSAGEVAFSGGIGTTTGIAATTGDTVHFFFNFAGPKVYIYVWKNAASMPTSPNLIGTWTFNGPYIAFGAISNATIDNVIVRPSINSSQSAYISGPTLFTISSNHSAYIHGVSSVTTGHLAYIVSIGSITGSHLAFVSGTIIPAVESFKGAYIRGVDTGGGGGGGGGDPGGVLGGGGTGGGVGGDPLPQQFGEIELTHQVIAILGDNRFNDEMVVTSSSTKTSPHGIMPWVIPDFAGTIVDDSNMIREQDGGIWYGSGGHITATNPLDSSTYDLYKTNYIYINDPSWIDQNGRGMFGSLLWKNAWNGNNTTNPSWDSNFTFTYLGNRELDTIARTCGVFEASRWSVGAIEADIFTRDTNTGQINLTGGTNAAYAEGALPTYGRTYQMNLDGNFNDAVWPKAFVMTGSYMIPSGNTFAVTVRCASYLPYGGNPLTFVDVPDYITRTEAVGLGGVTFHISGDGSIRATLNPTFASRAAFTPGAYDVLPLTDIGAASVGFGIAGQWMQYKIAVNGKRILLKTWAGAEPVSTDPNPLVDNSWMLEVADARWDGRNYGASGDISSGDLPLPLRENNGQQNTYWGIGYYGGSADTLSLGEMRIYSLDRLTAPVSTTVDKTWTEVNNITLSPHEGYATLGADSFMRRPYANNQYQESNTYVMGRFTGAGNLTMCFLGSQIRRTDNPQLLENSLVVIITNTEINAYHSKLDGTPLVLLSNMPFVTPILPGEYFRFYISTDEDGAPDVDNTSVVLEVGHQLIPTPMYWKGLPGVGKTQTSIGVTAGGDPVELYATELFFGHRGRFKWQHWFTSALNGVVQTHGTYTESADGYFITMGGKAYDNTVIPKHAYGIWEHKLPTDMDMLIYSFAFSNYDYVGGSGSNYQPERGHAIFNFRSPFSSTNKTYLDDSYILAFGNSGTPLMRLAKVDALSNITVVASFSLAPYFAAMPGGTADTGLFNAIIRIQTVGPDINIKIWNPITDDEPVGYQISYTDSGYVAHADNYFLMGVSNQIGI